MEGADGFPVNYRCIPSLYNTLIKSPSQAVETHKGGRLGFWSPNCYHHVLSYILEDIQVSDINNPDVSLNGLQVN